MIVWTKPQLFQIPFLILGNLKVSLSIDFYLYLLICILSVYKFTQQEVDAFWIYIDFEKY